MFNLFKYLYVTVNSRYGSASIAEGLGSIIGEISTQNSPLACMKSVISPEVLEWDLMVPSEVLGFVGKGISNQLRGMNI